jgi:kinetochore protein Spc24, fungi type
MLHFAYAFSLPALARVLDAARTSATRPPTVPSAERHAENLNHLDHTRLSLAKALNDAESSVANKEAELTRLKEELRQLEESDPAAEHQLDGTP